MSKRYYTSLLTIEILTLHCNMTSLEEAKHSTYKITPPATPSKKLTTNFAVSFFAFP